MKIYDPNPYKVVRRKDKLIRLYSDGSIEVICEIIKKKKLCTK